VSIVPAAPTGVAPAAAGVVTAYFSGP
jgi:hypothetical protein